VLTAYDADKHRQRKDKRQALAHKPFDLASCYGCGASLQTVEEAASGYVACSNCMFQVFSDVSEACYKFFVQMLQK
jgi:DNA-directed RNA polymerase subunit RPC12/RpoP